MRKTLLAILTVFFISLFGASAEAGKTVLVKCAFATPKINHPHYKHTKVYCVNPGFWVRISRRKAIALGTYPIIFEAKNG